MQDITQWFLEECDGLFWGELVKPSALTMMDAMKAIQLLDPKMDTGILNNFKSPYMFHPEDPLTPEELCWIMDNMTALEISWYRGATLCQSVYTCLYYHNSYMMDPSFEPRQLTEEGVLLSQILRAYLLLYCKTIDLVYTELSKGNTIEGEDCWLDHYGLPIKVNDDVEAIVEFANEALAWLENVKADSLDAFGDQLINRLVFRRNYLRYLDCAASVDISLEQTLLVMQLTAQDTSPSAIQPSEIIRLGFDPKIPSYLRQNMPLPEFRQPTFKQSWECMINMTEELLHVERLMDTGDWMQWKAFFWGMTLNDRERPPILRSLIQSRFTAFCYDSHQDHRNIDRLANEAILYECGDRNEVVKMLHTLDSMVGDPNMQQLKTWRALISKDIMMDLIMPLRNPPRQRRSLISLSTQWQHRMMMGSRLSSQHEFSPILVSVIEVFRLDCLLEAALSAIGLNLIHFSEEREVWWWISEVAATRTSAPVNSSSFKAIWAQIWTYIGFAMQILLVLVPLPFDDSTLSKPRFALRHKHLLYVTQVPRDSVTDVGLSPKYEKWISQRSQLDRKQGSCGLKEVTKLFSKARESLDGLLMQQSRNLRTVNHIVSLRQALEHNIRLISEIGTERNLMWDLNTNDRKARWIMLLLATDTVTSNE
ncbi:hypothetical protein J007_03411 [Cryptococcus neoformans]|nr:hypothetical protein J007_03411 [Cryptococcus neoformans var. grubii]OXC61060.1 hypothetical protein C358_03504 [Cryptococcus neoformans var. grubii MW-RSA852]